MLMKSKVIQQSCIYLFLIVFMVFVLFPLVWGVLASFKTNEEMNETKWFPQHFTLQNYYGIIFDYKPFFQGFLNSIIVASSSTILSTFLALLGGYGFSKFEFIGKKVLFSITLGAQYLPAATLVVPFFILVSRLRLLDTYWGLIIYFLLITVPFAVWLLTNYLANIPQEVEEAAMIDGCSYFKVLYKIVLPIIRPGIFVTMVLVFLQVWQAYLMPLVLTQTMKSKTVPIVLQELEGQASFSVGQILAGTLLFCLPVIFAFFVFHKNFMGGVEITSK